MFSELLCGLSSGISRRFSSRGVGGGVLDRLRAMLWKSTIVSSTEARGLSEAGARKESTRPKPRSLSIHESVVNNEESPLLGFSTGFSATSVSVTSVSDVRFNVGTTAAVSDVLSVCSSLE